MSTFQPEAAPHFCSAQVCISRLLLESRSSPSCSCEYVNTLIQMPDPTTTHSGHRLSPLCCCFITGVHRNPIFDVSAGAADGETDPAQQSRVISSRRGPQPEAPPFLRLLRAGAESGDFTSFAGHLRGLAPAAVDRELRSMQVGLCMAARDSGWVLGLFV